MADWLTTLDGLPGLSAEQKGKARAILMTKSEKEASLLVSGPADVAAEAVKAMLAMAAGVGVGSAPAAAASAANWGAVPLLGTDGLKDRFLTVAVAFILVMCAGVVLALVAKWANHNDPANVLIST
ncbi:hypothetical protein TSOC_014530 [Tetrabaena socialis]|uniref:Uncharacterized protein n=1 Tax=Tetrabaena socialis TaxID=47790 RepID=A0A2J7ZHE4_9CHLO|nr:hypothetical protein TSOC_014530 [Tetrabaena socialis]|eukprot:PNG99686.1 hypothetical protein TSOC_014530 [Tetrabaena socialis]